MNPPIAAALKPTHVRIVRALRDRAAFGPASARTPTQLGLDRLDPAYWAQLEHSGAIRGVMPASAARQAFYLTAAGLEALEETEELGWMHRALAWAVPPQAPVRGVA